MKPYYETKLGKLFNGDHIDIMPNLEPVDLTITSPPYDDLRTYNGFKFDYKKTIEQLAIITKAGGVVVWVVGDQTINGSESGTSFKQALYSKESGFNIHDTMIYEKTNPPPVNGNRYYSCFEFMFIFSKSKPRVFNPIQRKRRNINNDKRKSRVKNFIRSKEGGFVKKYVELKDFVKLSNVWKYKVGLGNSTSDKIAFRHPAIFPEALARDHIVSWSNENDIVLDPMCGSGTVCKQAEILGRRWVGIEISEEYCEIVAKRIDKENKQMKLC